MPFGGGGGGTQTVTQSNVPFNASELRTVQDAAIGLLNNNPLSYYPGQTYANPTDLQNATLGASGTNAFNAGNLTAPTAGPEQLTAMLNANGIANGDFFPNSFINAYTGLAGNNPAAGQIGTLNGLSDTNNPLMQNLSNPLGTSAGQNLNYYAQGGNLSGTSGIVGALENSYGMPGAGSLGGIANGNYLTNANPMLSLLGSAGMGGPGSNALAAVYNGGASNAVSPYASGLTQVGNNASGAVSPYSSGLAGYGYSAPGSVSPYTSGLTGVASGGPAASQLAATANGDYLGANPYLNSMFQAASQPLVNQYMTATAPQSDSNLEQYGRFSSQDTGRSGADTVLQNVNQQNLGKSLADLQAGIYGPAYQQERSNMVNAATGLGSLQTNALNAAGSLKNAATGLGINALGTGGGLQNTATGLNLTGLENAGGLVGQGVNSTINAALGGGNLFTQGLTNELGAYNQGVNTIAGAGSNLLSNEIGALGQAGNIYNTGAGISENAASGLLNNQTSGISNAIQAAIDAATRSGTLGISGQNSQITALNGGLNALNTGVENQLSGDKLAPSLSNLGFNDYQTALSAGNNQQQLLQQQLNDLSQRFYGNQFAPYQTIGQVGGIVGTGIPGTTALTTPIGGSGIGQLLGGLGAANSLFGSGSGSLFGSNGALGGLSGGGGLGGLFGTDGLLGASSIGELGTGGINSALAGAAGVDSLPFTSIAGTEATGGIISDFLPLFL